LAVRQEKLPRWDLVRNAPGMPTNYPDLVRLVTEDCIRAE